MIRIELVRVGHHYIGKTVSDRWNLLQFGICRIVVDRNHAVIKRLRRMLATEGFTISVARREAVVYVATASERAALGLACPIFNPAETHEGINTHVA